MFYSSTFLFHTFQENDQYFLPWPSGHHIIIIIITNAGRKSRKANVAQDKCWGGTGHVEQDIIGGTCVEKRTFQGHPLSDAGISTL